MVNFRRVVTALAVLALFTGLAFAQQQESCSVNQGTVSNPLRAEGFTELIGDIVIQCTGGQPLSVGAPVPLVNLTVVFNTTVTSRLLSTSGNLAGQLPSEALLIIDDPATQPGATPVIGVGIPTIMPGNTEPLLACTSSTLGCAQVVGPNIGVFAHATVAGGGQAQNVYQGLVKDASVSFYGIPALPPSTQGTRTYRITNVRVDATKGGAASGTTPVQAFITFPGFTLSNSQPIVGYISPGMVASVSGAKGFQQCVSVTSTSGSTNTTLRFTEQFGAAFKTRVIPQTTAAGSGQNGNIPNAPALLNQSQFILRNDSESGYVFTGFSGGTAGLADYGTRLKATFNNVPTGVRVWVTSTNSGQVTPTLAGNNSIASYAGFVGGDGTGAEGSSPTTFAAAALSEVSIVNGTGTAVWEVFNSNPNQAERFEFSVYISYTAATATNTPLPGTATVTLTYAPTATSGVASASLTVPRFSAGTGAFTGPVFSINVCRTVLLYPYVTNQQGFDTGLTVANTSQDPFTTGTNATAAQQGSCTLTFYGGTTTAPTTPPAPVTVPGGTGTIAGGTVWANTLGNIAPTFQGYVFAICNFQFAHGFAFISDVGARNIAMGYLALVIEDPGSDARQAAPPCIAGTVGILGCPIAGEQDAH